VPTVARATAGLRRHTQAVVARWSSCPPYVDGRARGEADGRQGAGSRAGRPVQQPWCEPDGLGGAGVARSGSGVLAVDGPPRRMPARHPAVAGLAGRRIVFLHRPGTAPSTTMPGEALVYEVAPSTAFGFGKGELSQTRWSFDRESTSDPNPASGRVRTRPATRSKPSRPPTSTPRWPDCQPATTNRLVGHMPVLTFGCRRWSRCAGTGTGTGELVCCQGACGPGWRLGLTRLLSR